MRLGETKQIDGTVLSVTMMLTDEPAEDGSGAIVFLIKSGSRAKSKVVAADGVAVRLIDEYAIKAGNIILCVPSQPVIP